MQDTGFGKVKALGAWSWSNQGLTWIEQPQVLIIRICSIIERNVYKIEKSDLESKEMG